ncbi:MAG: hypothetical protein HY906_27370 [Deltaproteobacteria bacterium]|nr:hypothetical protein [Deltaproteobacteria bacterium]
MRKGNGTGKGARATAVRRRRRDPRRLVVIGITPPDLAPGTAAARSDRRRAARATRPTGAALAKLPWLSQERAYRAGYYLLTHGLRRHARHPEIEVCNVPGVLLRAAQDLLNDVADFVLNDGRVKDGDTMLLGEDPLAVVGFREIGTRRSGTVHDLPVLRVVFLR